MYLLLLGCQWMPRVQNKAFSSRVEASRESRCLKKKPKHLPGRVLASSTGGALWDFSWPPSVGLFMDNFAA